MLTTDEMYMARCIQLAKNGAENTAPNPTVGAVIVYEGKIIGEGYHIRCGEAHAEVNAISSVKDKSLLKKATIYVSLEPCSHYGKTPPCADLIVKMQIPRVVIGCVDPFAKVSGRGIQKLKDANIDICVGVLEKECKELIKRFITFHSKQRPYIILKWAESADGLIDISRNAGTPAILSTPLTSMIVHKRRAEADGIMVGTHTAEMDNPSLNVRNWYGNNPTRIVVDKCLRLSDNLNLFDGSLKTIVFTYQDKENKDNVEYIKLEEKTDLLFAILTVLYEKQIQTILVEGGRALLQSFIDTGYWDEAFIEKSPSLLNRGVAAPRIEKATGFREESYFNRRILHYTNVPEIQTK